MAAQGLFLLSVIVLMFLFEIGSCLRCYECTTSLDKSCADPYTKPKNHVHDCILEDSQCGKFTIETPESNIIVRQCFNTFINCDTVIAKTNALTTNEKIKHCISCHGDLCNGVSSASFSIPLTIVSLFVLQVIIYSLF